MTDDLAEEIAEHQPVADRYPWCAHCRHYWPCLVRRLAVENAWLRVALEPSLRALHEMLRTGRIECRCWGADACDPHAVLSDMEHVLGSEQPAPEREG